MRRPAHYKPFREDLPLGLYTWFYAAGAYTGFVLLSVWQGVGVFWGLLTGGVILLSGHTAWRSSAGARIMKRVLTKSLFGFALDFVRTRSIEQAAEGMVDPSDDPKNDVFTIIQRQSRWLWVMPMLLFLFTKAVDAMTSHSLAYFLIAELYFALAGVIWMSLCRRGRLIMLSFEKMEGV